MKCKTLDSLLKKWKRILIERYSAQGCWEKIVELSAENLKAITEDFYDYNLNDTQFDTAILLDEHYHQRLSEIIVAHRLSRDGFELSSKDFGPDFKATKNGQTVWFEVVTPNPNDEMAQELEDIPGRLFPKHETESRLDYLALLKMLSAIKSKSEIIKKYIKQKVIPKNEPVVIVVNDSLFYPLDVRMVGVTEELYKGQSGLPLVIEALLGLDNPYWQPLESSHGSYQIMWRERASVLKDNGSLVPTNGFLSEEYRHISGVFVMTAREDYGLSLAVYENKRNVGLLVKNLYSNNILPDNLLNTRIYDSNKLHRLLNPDLREPITGLGTTTLNGQYFLMVQELNNYFKKAK